MVQTPTTQSLSPLARGAGMVYTVLAGLFTLGVVIMVFLAGLGVLVSPSYFVWHETFSHVIEFVPVLMLLVGFFAKLRWQTLALTALLFALFMLQYVFLYLMPQLGLMPLRALHAVNALALFSLSSHLRKIVWERLQPTRHETKMQNLQRSGEQEVSL
jgi:hypothetical protein